MTSSGACTWYSRTGLTIVCPITNTDTHFPFHLPIVDDPYLTGFVMVEQVKSIDFRAGKVKFIGKAAQGALEEVLAILDACIL
jgi:mRNA interferase MazF